MKIEQSIIDTLTEAATGIRDERRLAANTAGRIGGMFLDIIAALGLVDTREAGVSRWGDLQDRPTTLEGFGITDAWTKEEAMELFMSREVLDDLFVKVPIETHEDEGGKTVVDRWAIRANYTLFSVGDVAAFGREDGIETGGGTGGVGSFAELGEVVDADGPTAERPYWGWIPSSGTTAGHYGWISGDGKGLGSVTWGDVEGKPASLEGYGILEDVKRLIPYGDGGTVVRNTNAAGGMYYSVNTENVATRKWVEAKNYLTAHQSLAGYYTSGEIDALLVRQQDALGTHEGDASVHVTENERNAWNGKANKSDIKTYGLGVSGNNVQIVEGGKTTAITVPYADTAGYTMVMRSEADLTDLNKPTWAKNGGLVLQQWSRQNTQNQPREFDNANIVLNINGAIHGYNCHYGWQMAFQDYKDYVFLRRAAPMPTDRKDENGNTIYEQGYDEWRQLAFIDSTVANATKFNNKSDDVFAHRNGNVLTDTNGVKGGGFYIEYDRIINNVSVQSCLYLQSCTGSDGVPSNYIKSQETRDSGNAPLYLCGNSVSNVPYIGLIADYTWTNGKLAVNKWKYDGDDTLYVNGNARIESSLRVGGAILTYSNGILAFTDANGKPLHITASGDVVAYSGADVEGLNLSLGQLSNVNVNAATAGQALVYRNGVWVAETVKSGIDKVEWKDLQGTVPDLGLFTNSAGYIKSDYVMMQTFDEEEGLGPLGFALRVGNDSVMGLGMGFAAYLNNHVENTDIHLTADRLTAINNGVTAYGWGNHAVAGYLKSTDAATTYLGINAKAADSAKLNGKSDSAFVHIAGVETITGQKTFSDNTYVNNIYVGNGKTIYENYNGAYYNVLDVHPNYGVLSIGWGSARIPSSVLANDNNYGDTIIYGKGIFLRAVEHKADGTFADKNAVRVLSNGYVGINDAYPSHPLHVNGSSRLAGNVTMGRDDSNAAVLYAVTVLGDRNVLELNKDNLHVGYGILGKGNTSLYGNNFYFYTHGQSTSVEITQLGLLYAKDGARFDCDIEINGNGGSRLPNHFYHKVYDSAGNVYEHFYDNLTSTPNSIANLRVASGGSFRTFRLDGYTNNGYDGLMSWDGDAMIQGKLQLGTNSAKIWYDASIDTFRCNKTIVSDGDVVAFGGIGTIESPTLENLTVRNLNVTESAGVLRSESIRVKNTSLGGEDGNFTIGCPGDTYITSNSQFAAIFSQNGSWINKLFIGDSEEAISEVTVDKKYTSGSSGFYLHITINGERYRLTCYKES